MKEFKPNVLEVYKQRFRSAVNSYLKFLENPGAWKAKTQDRTNQKKLNDAPEKLSAYNEAQPDKIAAKFCLWHDLSLDGHRCLLFQRQ